MLKLAWRNLVHERTRLIISVGGVALAVLLILVMEGVFAGLEEHAVAYIRNQPAPLWLMQDGVENMHMSSSILPPETIEKVSAADGVKAAVGSLYTNAGVDVQGNLVYSYIFAVDSGAPFGGPWKLVDGTSDIQRDQIIMDRDLVGRYGLGMGDKIGFLGNELTIAGLSEGTFGIATSISFVNKEALAWLLGVPSQSASYILVQPEIGTEVGLLAERLREVAPEANLLMQDEFVASDQEMIRQMGADVIRAMNSVAYLVGLLVIGLTIYTATVERSREYGVLKAIGASNGDLLRAVFAQAFVSAGLGFLVGVALSYLVASLVGRTFPEMLILVPLERVVRQLPVLAVVTTLAALMPIGRVVRLDPMVVFKA